MLAFTPTPVPLVTLDDGTIRITGTRVPLDTIVYAFRTGSGPDDITRMYTTVTLEAAYAVIAWVLQHKDEVDAYMTRREEESARIREECERANPSDEFWERLRARKNKSSG
jgi:uncharacterized protein (DUF433 family)